MPSNGRENPAQRHPGDAPVNRLLGSWCGPATARIILASRGINVPEAELAREIGTHQGGTDHIGWIVDRSFRHRAPQAGYEGVPMHQDPPSQAQRDTFWQHLRRSIDAGWGLAMNWVAPIGNYPIGIKGTTSPSYGPSTVYHYVAAVGYDTNPEAVWIADPGFRPFSFWVSRRQCESLIPPKAYAWASASGPAVPTPPAVRDPLDLLIETMAPTTVSRARFNELLPAVVEALDRSQCHNVERISQWCAQIGHESGGLRYMEEIADGSAYEGRQDLGNTQPGDGRRYKGRGPIQITGRHNYTILSQWAHTNGYVPSATYFVDNPEQLASDKYGFLGVVWYWTVARPQINAMSDRRDIEGVTRAINGGLNGLADRTARWNRCLAIGNRLLDLKTTAAPPAPPGEGFLMSLTPDEQREILILLRVLADDRYMSISPFRHLDEQGNKAAAVTTAKRVDFVDGNVHVVMSLMLASMGDPEHLALLREVASAAGDPRYPDRQHDARLAQLVLDWAAETGRPESEAPVPPPFVCLINNTGRCAIEGAPAGGPCLITGAACVRTVLGAGM